MMPSTEMVKQNALIDAALKSVLNSPTPMRISELATYMFDRYSHGSIHRPGMSNFMWQSEFEEALRNLFARIEECQNQKKWPKPDGKRNAKPSGRNAKSSAKPRSRSTASAGARTNSSSGRTSR